MIGNNIVHSVHGRWPLLRGGSGSFPYEHGRHLVVTGILHTFADESGIEDTAKFCIIAGYIGEPREWEKLRREWRRTLRKFRVPEFHAKDFYQPERRKNVAHFADWTDEKCSAFLGRLLRAINDHKVDPICVSLSVPDFNQFDKDERQYLTGGILATKAIGYDDGVTVAFAEKFKSSGAPSKPYMAIFQRFIGEALLKAEEETAVHFTFDLQNVYEARAIETFHEQFKADYLPDHLRRLGERAASIKYADSASEEPLQAADLCAYFWNRALNGSVRGRLLTETAEAFGEKPHRMSKFTREHLQRIRL